ncbi:hypothetical protein B0J18DRAFT_413673 [Chaetomium sp. MPI-SDFR-AT-0129]|nr:hypothetical protein B0J18DRAFT_413673 [Chaetomium sp. MPI-SDFR-AT-0129]
MGDPISLASGLVALVTFALASSTLLYDTVQSYRSHPNNVRDLKDELGALTGVLRALSETVEQNKATDFTALKLPLLRCGNACREFDEVIAKCSSHSGGSKTSFRDWAKLKYMGDGIDEFRSMLAGYKSTINTALADANLRQSSVTNGEQTWEPYGVMDETQEYERLYGPVARPQTQLDTLTREMTALRDENATLQDETATLRDENATLRHQLHQAQEQQQAGPSSPNNQVCTKDYTLKAKRKE